ncbi:hypothetical protein [Marinobacter sp. SS13-12]|uniref:hypothetical protein n=1 Tax=Marinobacter sp. SS13-12 TaxID=3050451 RepID=UPI0025552E88|nr:hypothetical protein [Marinobacter sp. SS13-12]MDK8463851.1 hypothetical protein [Marinobacter sp. SS13-12]
MTIDATKTKKSFVIEWILVLIILSQNHPWFLWPNSYIFSVILIGVLFFLCASRLSSISVNCNFLAISSLTIILLLFFCVYASLQTFRTSSFISIAVFVLVFALNKGEKLKALDKLTTLLTLIVFLSIVARVTNEYFFSLPHSPLSYPDGKGDIPDLGIKNFFLYIEPAGLAGNRLYSIFDEPGTLGTLVAFMLVGNNFNFRDVRNLVLLLGGILTFSLAFFIISAFGFFLLRLGSPLKMAKGVLLLVLAVLGSVIFFWDNDAFRIIVIDRIAGLFVFGLESRSPPVLDVFFSDYIISLDALLGMGTNFHLENPTIFLGQSYKLFLIEYGFVGLFLVFSLYFCLILRDWKIGLVCLAVFFVSFLQRPFLFTPWQILLFSMVFESLLFVKSSSFGLYRGNYTVAQNYQWRKREKL